MTVFFARTTKVYRMEYMPVQALHALVNHTEWELRAELAVKPGKYDLRRVRALVAKLKFLTWCTLFPSGDKIEVDWAESIDFELREEEVSDMQIGMQLVELIPEYMFWLDRGNFRNEVPAYEVWEQFACL